MDIFQAAVLPVLNAVKETYAGPKEKIRATSTLMATYRMPAKEQPPVTPL